MSEIPVAHQIEYLRQCVVNKKKIIESLTDLARNLSPDLKDTVMAGRQDELAYLEAILETVENAGMAKCSLCGKPQAKENTFICFSCIPFDDGK